jgi:hypothetical protein
LLGEDEKAWLVFRKFLDDFLAVSKIILIFAPYHFDA